MPPWKGGKSSSNNEHNYGPIGSDSEYCIQRDIINSLSFSICNNFVIFSEKFLLYTLVETQHCCVSTRIRKE